MQRYAAAALVMDTGDGDLNQDHVVENRHYSNKSQNQKKNILVSAKLMIMTVMVVAIIIIVVARNLCIRAAPPDVLSHRESHPAGGITPNLHFSFPKPKAKECKCVDCPEDEICGGLWKGNSYEGLPKDNEHDNLSQKIRVHIVVSHCKADLHWMSEFTGEYTRYADIVSIHIITKCGQEVIGAPDMATIEELPNMGRCDHSYAKYITSVLDEKLSKEKDDNDNNNDSSIVMFLKDDMSNANLHQKAKWNNFEYMLRVASSSNGFGCGLIHDQLVHFQGNSYDISTYYLTEKLFEFSLEDYDRRKDMYQGDGISFKSGFENLGSFFLSVLNKDDNSGTGQSSSSSLPAPPSKVVQVCYGGIFATTVSNIKRVDSSVWKAAEMALRRGDSIEEGHFMERSWAHLLATPLEQFQINALLQYAEDEKDRLAFDIRYRKSIEGVLFRNVKRDLGGTSQRARLNAWKKLLPKNG